MKINLIKTEKDYDKALARIDEIIDAKEGTVEYDELELISILVGQYEDKHYAIEDVDPIELLEFLMEQNNLKQKDLVPSLGAASRVSEILNRSRKLTLDMIRNLHRNFGIPTEVLIQEY